MISAPKGALHFLVAYGEKSFKSIQIFQILLYIILICMICDDLYDFCPERGTPFLSRLR